MLQSQSCFPESALIYLKLVYFRYFTKTKRNVIFKRFLTMNILIGAVEASHLCKITVFSSPELAQGELLGYCDVRRPSYVWTSVTSETSETYETSETSVRQLFSLCTL